jgi:hypothetical protein
VDPRLKKKAMVLWREFARRTYALDIEAVDALTLRDELEVAELSSAEWSEVRQLDEETIQRIQEAVDDLKRTGALQAIGRIRGEKSKAQWWWWLDHKVEGRPTPCTRSLTARPGARQLATGVPLYTLYSAAPTT